MLIGKSIMKIDLERIKKENDKLIMEAHGLEYEKIFSQVHRCEK